MKNSRWVMLAILGLLLFAILPSDAATRPIAHVPTGTGYIRVTNGTEDSAAAAIDLSNSTYVTGTLPVSMGGTGQTSAILMFDMALMGYQARNQASSTLSETAGYQYNIYAEKTLVGVKTLHYDDGNTRTITAKVYASGGVLLASKAASNVPSDTLTTITFDSPVTLPATAAAIAGSQINIAVTIDGGSGTGMRPPYFGTASAYHAVGIDYPAWISPGVLQVSWIWCSGTCSGGIFTAATSNTFVALTPLFR